MNGIQLEICIDNIPNHTVDGIIPSFYRVVIKHNPDSWAVQFFYGNTKEPDIIRNAETLDKLTSLVRTEMRVDILGIKILEPENADAILQAALKGQDDGKKLYGQNLTLSYVQIGAWMYDKGSIADISTEYWEIYRNNFHTGYKVAKEANQ